LRWILASRGQPAFGQTSRPSSLPLSPYSNQFCVPQKTDWSKSMYISYQYQENTYRVLVDWTSADGKSTVFRDVIRKAAERHGFDVGELQELAEHLDMLTDKLYGQIQNFIDEYEAVPFDPCFRKIILKSFTEIVVCINDTTNLGNEGGEGLAAGMFMDVADKLRELVKVYLEERAYQSKYRDRLRHKEQYIEATSPAQLSCEFEDVLLQMTDIARQMDCLSEIQRRLLVKHIFLKYTFREIANQEGMSKSKVHSCVSAAIKRIKERLA
jgi:hypothetical protein